MIGPVFTREASIAPRRVSFYAAPTVFVAALFALTLTSWQLLVGAQRIENLGDLAWFGAAVFQILAPLQLAVAMPFAALLVASAVALEKDRKTLDLLLMTNLTNSELVLGKLLASMLHVLIVVVATLPMLLMLALLGGVSALQILEVQGVTLAGALAAGSLGSLLALWREKTFQALALTLLVLVLWLVAWEIVATGAFGRAWFGIPVERWAVAMSPWQAVNLAAQPHFADALELQPRPVHLFLLTAVAIAALLNVVAIVRVRVWNPSREVSRRDERQEGQAAEGEPTRGGVSPGLETGRLGETARGAAAERAVVRIHSAGGRVRPVWDNPILWREVRTWAFGKKILVIRLAYWAMFFVCAAALVRIVADRPVAAAIEAIPLAAQPLAALLIVSLILLNALAVTSLTGERDSRALDLLLVTDLTPKEIVFGKLGGAFYNAKEMVLLPILLCAYLWYVGYLGTENFLFLLGGLAVMNAFAAVLGLHAGMTYANSRTAIATSIGTLLFLFLGIATCMRIMLAFSHAFQYQLGAFLGFIGGGAVGLFVALGWRNPSPAIALASGILPFVMFFVIVSYLLGHYGVVFLLTAFSYGFTTWAMLFPAISEFDIATGRTTAREE